MKNNRRTDGHYNQSERRNPALEVSSETPKEAVEGSTNDKNRAAWMPPSEWQDIEIRRGENTSLYREEDPKTNSADIEDKVSNKDASDEKKSMNNDDLRNTRDVSSEKGSNKISIPAIESPAKNVPIKDERTMNTSDSVKMASTKEKSKQRVPKSKTSSFDDFKSPIALDSREKKLKRSIGISTSEANPFSSRPGELGPFAHRPTLAGPFAERPVCVDTECHEEENDINTSSKVSNSPERLSESYSSKRKSMIRKEVDQDEEDTSSDDKSIQSVEWSRERSTPKQKLTLNRVVSKKEEDDDEKSTQSVDRHLVRESSHRRLLRKQVADRREALSSILQATKKHALPEEDDLLDLKRKLALSQALIQKLELKNDAIRRQAVLDVARAQMVLLEQRDNREKELEKQIKELMQERNAAVHECHELRILIMGSCELCKRRFDGTKQYFMDHYVRNTVLSSRERPNSSAFEWFTGNLSEEALDLEITPAFRSSGSFDPETISLGASTASNFKTTPLTWLSDKLFGSQEDYTHTDLCAIPIRSINLETLGVSKEGTILRDDAIAAASGSGAIASQENQTLVDVNETSVDYDRNTSNEGMSVEGNVLDEGTSPANDTVDHSSIQLESDTSSSNNLTTSSSTIGNNAASQNMETKKNRSFFSSLMGEKVADEFSSLSLPTGILEKKDNSKRFSIFGSLRGEKVKEDKLFSGLSPSLAFISEEDTSGAIRKKKNDAKSRSGLLGLKSEQVLDDMDLLNSLVSITGHTSNGVVSAPKKRGLSGLKNEKVNDDLIDDHLLRTSGAPLIKNSTAKPKSRSSLSQETVNVEAHDDQLLSLLNQGSTPSKQELMSKSKDRPTLSQETVNVEEYDDQLLSLLGASIQPNSIQQGKPENNLVELKDENENLADKHILQAAKQHITEQSPPSYASPVKPRKKLSMAGSNLTSPFAGGRKRLSTKREGSSSSKYLGKYRSSSPSPGTPSRAKIEAADVDIDGMTLFDSATSSPQAELTLDPPLDLGVRPWRKGVKRDKSNEEDTSPKKLEPSNVISNEVGETPTDSNEIDEIDHVANLMERESSAWD